MEVTSLYIHIPYCRTKCHHCDFGSHVLLDAAEQLDRYVAALTQEIRRSEPGRVATVYIGGGTPTVLPLSHFADIMEAARRSFAIVSDAEITVEANPGTLDHGVVSSLLSLGVTRLSLGVQSFDDPELCILGRTHTASEAAEAFNMARRAGFENINLDLIYGLPRQSLDSWRESLEQVLDLEPEHVSLYALSVEEGTPMAGAIARGELRAPDPDLAADMYDLSQQSLGAAGYVHYEISNWAKTASHQCRHNLAYWRNQTYLGMGSGAHSWAKGRRWANASEPGDYVARILSERRPVEWEEEIEIALEMGETMMMGLRLLEEGVTHDRFRRRFGVTLAEQYADELENLVGLGLLVDDGERVRLSERGRLLGNRVFGRFLPDSS
jgi:oxygen-independent coproporphyrinogen-3 oxidase